MTPDEEHEFYARPENQEPQGPAIGPDGLPLHCPISVTADGQGPVHPDNPEFDHWECWCPDPDCRIGLDE